MKSVAQKEGTTSRQAEKTTQGETERLKLIGDCLEEIFEAEIPFDSGPFMREYQLQYLHHI